MSAKFPTSAPSPERTSSTHVSFKTTSMLRRHFTFMYYAAAGSKRGRRVHWHDEEKRDARHSICSRFFSFRRKWFPSNSVLVRHFLQDFIHISRFDHSNGFLSMAFSGSDSDSPPPELTCSSSLGHFGRLPWSTTHDGCFLV